MRAASASMLVLALVAPMVPVASAATFQVTAFNGFWSPSSLQIDVGDSVEFLLGQGFHNWEVVGGGDSCDLPCTRTFSTEGSVSYRCGIHPSMTGTIAIGAPPTVTIATPAAGATVGGTVQVTGSATHPTLAITQVTVRIGSAAAVTATLGGSGTSVTWSADVPTTSILNGAQTLVARATVSNGVFGTASIPITIDNPPSVDVVVTSASASQGATTTNLLSFTVRNDGNAGGRVTVLAEYLYHGTWRAIGTTLTPVVNPGQTVQGSIAWTTGTSPHVGSFSVRFTADPNMVLPDPNRANNVRTTTAGWVTTLVPGLIVTEPV